MELKELINLLYLARNKFETIQMEWVYAYDEKILHEMFNNQSNESWVLLREIDAKRISLPNDPSHFSSVHQKILLQKQHCLRFESEVKKGATIWIANGKQEWHIEPSNFIKRRRIKRIERELPINVLDEVINIQAGELLDPSFLLSSHDILAMGEERFLNREAVKFRALPRKGKDGGRESYFWRSTDEIEILVDKHRGTILHYEMKVNDSKFAYATVSKIIFDANIPKSAFLIENE